MPPAYLHAVYTPIDSLVVGGFFLSASNIATSMLSATILEHHPSLTNDDLLVQTPAAWEGYCRDLLRQGECDQPVDTNVAARTENIALSLAQLCGEKAAKPNPKGTKNAGKYPDDKYKAELARFVNVVRKEWWIARFWLIADKWRSDRDSGNLSTVHRLINTKNKEEEEIDYS